MPFVPSHSLGHKQHGVTFINNMQFLLIEERVTANGAMRQPLRVLRLASHNSQRGRQVLLSSYYVLSTRAIAQVGRSFRSSVGLMTFQLTLKKAFLLNHVRSRKRQHRLLCAFKASHAEHGVVRKRRTTRSSICLPSHVRTDFAAQLQSACQP